MDKDAVRLLIIHAIATKGNYMLTFAELQVKCPAIQGLLESHRLSSTQIVGCNYHVVTSNSPLFKPRRNSRLSAWVVGKKHDSHYIIRVNKLGGWLSPATILSSVKKDFCIGFVVVFFKHSPKRYSIHVYCDEVGDLRSQLCYAYADNVMGY